MESEDHEEWTKAIDSELRSLAQHGVWDLVEMPQNRKLVGCKWVFKIKTNAEGKIERYKARLCAKGFTQIYGIDYNQTYAPVASHPTLRLFTAIVVERDMKVYN